MLDDWIPANTIESLTVVLLAELHKYFLSKKVHAYFQETKIIRKITFQKVLTYLSGVTTVTYPKEAE